MQVKQLWNRKKYLNIWKWKKKYK